MRSVSMGFYLEHGVPYEIKLSGSQQNFTIVVKHLIYYTSVFTLKVSTQGILGGSPGRTHTV